MGGAGHDERNLGVLEHIEGLLHHAGIAEPDGGHHPLRSQLLRSGQTRLRITAIVLDDQLQGPPQISAHGIDLAGRQLNALQHRLTEIRRRAGERANHAYPYGVALLGTQQRRCDQSQAADSDGQPGANPSHRECSFQERAQHSRHYS